MSTADEKTGVSLTTFAHAPVTETKSLATADTLTVSSPAVSLAGRPSNVSTPATAMNELNPFDTDLEAMISTRTLTGDDACGMKSASSSNLKGSAEGQVWPGQAHWKKKSKTAKQNKHSCQCLAKLSKRNRLLVKLMIGTFIIALGVGIGLGVSRKVGAPVWQPEDS